MPRVQNLSAKFLEFCFDASHHCMDHDYSDPYLYVYGDPKR